jgi:hypothetical protein
LSFEGQELPDAIRIIILLNLGKGKPMLKSSLKREIDKVCVIFSCIDRTEMNIGYAEMALEGLIIDTKDVVLLSGRNLDLVKNGEVFY